MGYKSRLGGARVYISKMVTELSSPELASIEALRARGVSAVGDGFIRSPLPVSELATRSVSLFALAVSTLSRHLGYSGTNDIHVDRGLCDAWFGLRVRPVGMVATAAVKPVSLPVQALDWATGYLAATAVVTGLTHRTAANRGSSWHLSLARTAHELNSLSPASEKVSQADVPPKLPGQVFASPLGRVFLASSPFRIGKVHLEFERVTTRLGHDEPLWQ